MKTISIRELHLKTGWWVRHAASRGPIVVTDLPSTVFLRSGDALHLACAEEHGFQEVYTNDRHMLQAARHFRVTGVNVLTGSS